MDCSTDETRCVCNEAIQDDKGDDEEKWIQSAQDDYDDIEYFLETHLNKRIKDEQQTVDRELRDQRVLSFQNTITALTQLIENPHAEINDSAIEGALSRLGARMQECTLIYEKLIANGTGDAIGGMTHEEISKEYNEICNKSHLLLGKNKERENPITTKRSNIKPQKLNFEKFSGDIRKYPRFRR